MVEEGTQATKYTNTNTQTFSRPGWNVWKYSYSNICSLDIIICHIISYILYYISCELMDCRKQIKVIKLGEAG